MMGFTMKMIIKNQSIQLAGGRTLGYAEYGNPDGQPIFYFHGHPGSRYEAGFLTEQAERLGVRLIGVDRPGMGLSSYQERRKIVDWPEDVTALADCLHIDRFSVIGYSAGGPYALACAYLIPNRLNACGIVSSAASPSWYLSFLPAWAYRLVMPIARRLFRDEKKVLKLMAQTMFIWIRPDRNVLSLPEVKKVVAASLVETLKQGAKGAVYDGALVECPWGFRLEEVAFPRVYLWHGLLDPEVSIHKGRKLAARLAHCQATYLPGEGHISPIINHAQEILQALT